MNRLNAKIKELKQTGRKALVAFLTAGYPDLTTTEELVLRLEKDGVDVIELGVPFSDPVADGPTIQFSSEAALRKGMNLDKVFSLVSRLRKKTEIPLVLMGYMNPFMRHGLEATFRKAGKCGVDGLIIPDLIPEESGPVKAAAKQNGMSLIFLAAPNTPNDRLSCIDKSSDGFVYIVSIAGVTGGRKKLPVDLSAYLKRTKAYIPGHLRFIGFGISGADQVRRLKPFADGVIVGSALIDIIRNNAGSRVRLEKAGRFVRSLRSALDR